MMLVSARKSLVVVCAAQPPPPPPKKPRRLPESGYFAPADPSLPIPKLRLTASSDITKRGGRWDNEFIWNTNWKEQLEYEEKLREESKQPPKTNQDDQGALKLTSVANLDDVQIDLTEQLKAASEKQKKRQLELEQRRRAAEAIRAARAASSSTSTSPSIAPQGPLRREVKRLERGNKFSTRPFAIAPSNPEEEALLETKRQEERARYDELKQELLAWTGALAVGTFGLTFAFYTRDIAASYGVGALGGYLYLRLLNQSVDSFGTGGSALGQPRLLIPVALVMVFNRWNILKADEVGLQLQLLPMLAGFFTYKAAVIFKNFGQLVQDFIPNSSSSSSTSAYSVETSQSEEAMNAAMDATSVDRAFTRRILKG